MVVKVQNGHLRFRFLASSPLSLPVFCTLVFSTFVLFLGNKKNAIKCTYNSDRRDLFLPFSSTMERSSGPKGAEKRTSWERENGNRAELLKAWLANH